APAGVSAARESAPFATDRSLFGRCACGPPHTRSPSHAVPLTRGPQRSQATTLAGQGRSTARCFPASPRSRRASSPGSSLACAGFVHVATDRSLFGRPSRAPFASRQRRSRAPSASSSELVAAPARLSRQRRPENDTGRALHEEDAP